MPKKKMPKSDNAHKNNTTVRGDIPNDLLMMELHNDVWSVYQVLHGASFAGGDPGSLERISCMYTEICPFVFVMRALAQALGRRPDSQDCRYDPKQDRLTYHANIAKRRAFLRHAEALYSTIKANLGRDERSHVEDCISAVEKRVNGRRRSPLRIVSAA